MLPKQSMMHPLFIRIKIIKHHVSVTRMTSSEDNYLEVIAQVLQNLSCVWPNIYARLDNFSRWKFNRQFNIIGNFNRLITMDKRFI